MKKVIAGLIKHNANVQKIYTLVFSTIFNIIGKFVNVDKNLILFVSYGGAKFNDSPKVIYDAMQQDPKWKKFEFVWAFEKPEEFELKVGKKVKIDTLHYFLIALKAKIWITNVNVERGLHFKPKETIYLNTWHGTGPKQGGNGVKGRSDYDFSYVDILCVDGEYAKNEMLSCFNARERNMLWCGRPREDELIFYQNNFDKERIKEKIGVKTGKKIILYMPTWREYETRRINVKLWSELLEDDYVVLIRNHHFFCDGNYEVKDSFLFDCSDYANVNELYWIADILISDYSSAFFDYGLLGKPMFCYAYDYEKYNKTSGLLMDLKTVFPRGIIESEEELLFKIRNIDYENYATECRAFCGKYVSHKLNATEACLNRLMVLLDK